MLRQETYAEDGTEREAHPYVVSERCYEVRRLQPRGEGAPHAVFFAHPREELAYQYERNPNDPRVLHTLTLENLPLVTGAGIASIGAGCGRLFEGTPAQLSLIHI